MPHQTFLPKINVHGIDDGIIDWIENILTDRRQRVVVDGEVSNWKSVLRGAPRRSVLSPLLFLIYINDLVFKFADNTNVFINVKNDGDQQYLQNDPDQLAKVSEKCQMLLNFGKCKRQRTQHGNLEKKLEDTVLGITITGKDLGVTISADMKVS